MEQCSVQCTSLHVQRNIGQYLWEGYRQGLISPSGAVITGGSLSVQCNIGGRVKGHYIIVHCNIDGMVK